MNCRDLNGFTLVELLVAIVVFVILAGMGYAGLASLIEQREHATASLQRTNEIRAVAHRLTEDLFTARPRPIDDPFGGQSLPGLRVDPDATPRLMLVRGGWLNPISRARSTHQRVAYSLEDGELVRLTWTVLDPAPDSEPIRQVMLAGVVRFEIRLLTGDDIWSQRWPNNGGTGIGSDRSSLARLPRAAEVLIEMEDWGEVRWLVEMIGA
jgi:general secretion pathway protein J